MAMNNPVIMHCNYGEPIESIDTIVDLAVNWGFDGIEFRRKRFDIVEDRDTYLDRIAKATERTKLKHVLFGAPGPDLTGTDADARKREVDDAIAFYREAAKRFKLTVCNTMTGLLKSDAPFMEFDKHGSAIATDEQFQWAVEGFQTLGDVATELGFKFAFETHNVYYHDLPAATMKLVRAIDRESVGVNLDYGNILIYPEMPVSLAETIETCKDRTYLLHLKNLYLTPGDRYNHFIPCPLSAGVINNREFLALVHANGYDGPIGIEQPRQGDRLHYAPQDLAYLKSLMAEIE